MSAKNLKTNDQMGQAMLQMILMSSYTISKLTNHFNKLRVNPVQECECKIISKLTQLTQTKVALTLVKSNSRFKIMLGTFNRFLAVKAMF